MERGDCAVSREIRLIGCCGANCATCRSFTNGQCKGCKIGYAEGTRRLSAAKCSVKSCCIGRGSLETCADCDDSPRCKILLEFHARKEAKYGSYSRPVEYIRKHGYLEYLRAARRWKGPFGSLD